MKQKDYGALTCRFPHRGKVSASNRPTLALARVCADFCEMYVNLRQINKQKSHLSLEIPPRREVPSRFLGDLIHHIGRDRLFLRGGTPITKTINLTLSIANRLIFYRFGLRVGNKMFSRIDQLLVKNIVNLSIPMPMPPTGGIPYSIASR